MTSSMDRYFITTYVALWAGLLAVIVIGSMVWTSSTVISMVDQVYPERDGAVRRSVSYPDKHGVFARQDHFENPLLKIPEPSRP